MRSALGVVFIAALASIAAARARPPAPAAPPAPPAPPAPSTPAAPIGAWTPVPELPGMGRPVDTASVATRRRALAARNGRGVILVPAGHERDIEREVIQDNDFRQINTLFYLTALETQYAW